MPTVERLLGSVSVKARPLHHIALGTSHVETLAQFYEQAVGLERFKIHHENDGRSIRSIWLRAGEVVVMIERTTEGERVARHSLISGWSTLVFSGTPDDAQLLAIKEFGGKPEGQTDYTRYFRDPDGNRFGISHYDFDGVP